jgi:hypothetical protein
MMSVKWSIPEGSYAYDCIFGCHAADFESAQEATDAEVIHDCMFPHVGGAA